MIIGLVIFLTGILIRPFVIKSDTRKTLLRISFSIFLGLVWGLDTGLVNYSIVKFDTPIALLIPFIT